MTQATIVRGNVLLPTRRIALSEELIERQIRRGLFTEYGGRQYALPVDDLHAMSFEGIDWCKDDEFGWHREGVIWDAPQPKPPVGLGMVMQGTCSAIHWHRDWAAPDGELHEPLDHAFATHPGHPGHVARKSHACARHAGMYGRASLDCKSGCEWEPLVDYQVRAILANSDRYLGFTEHLGILSLNKMTTAFVSEEVSELVSTTGTEFADFDFHEVGTSSAAEANTQTALTTTSGIARATGTPADEDPDYANDATVTADATETWEEHGVFNNSAGAAMMDRNLTGGQAVNSSDQVTYQGTFTLNPEA